MQLAQSGDNTQGLGNGGGGGKAKGYAEETNQHQKEPARYASGERHGYNVGPRAEQQEDWAGGKTKERGSFIRKEEGPAEGGISSVETSILKVVFIYRKEEGRYLRK